MKDSLFVCFRLHRNRFDNLSHTGIICLAGMISYLPFLTVAILNLHSSSLKKVSWKRAKVTPTSFLTSFYPTNFHFPFPLQHGYFWVVRLVNHQFSYSLYECVSFYHSILSLALLINPFLLAVDSLSYKHHTAADLLHVLDWFGTSPSVILSVLRHS